MSEHLLRIEAVNLDAILDDTPQLSVVRGSGLMALESVRAFDGQPLPPVGSAPRWLRRLRAWLRPSPTPALISGGASVGLYSLDLPRDPSPAPHAQLLAALSRHMADEYPYHSFVIDIEPIARTPGGFQQARNRILAKNRLRQLQQPSLSVAGCTARGSDRGPCDFDDLRPAALEQQLRRTAAGQPQSVWLSASVHQRYRHGAEQKTHFLNQTTGLGLSYVGSFDELAGDFPADRRLQNKLAVLYFDGNGFGALQDACETPAQLRDLDRYLQAQRQAMLTDLLRYLDRRSRDMAAPGSPGPLGFELLLWGGDEILFVVPAWIGLDALYRFYALSDHWAWQGQPLTHAGALVFCDHKTPIDRIRRLAHDLAERVKEQARQHQTPPPVQDPDPVGNRFDYLILESIDFPAEPLDDYFQQRYPALWRCRTALPVSAEAAAQIAALARLRDDALLPHGPLHEGALRLIASGDDCDQGDAAAAALKRDLERRAAASGSEAQAALRQLEDRLDALFGDQAAAWRWVHLAELWDYLGPRQPPRSTASNSAAQTAPTQPTPNQPTPTQQNGNAA